MYRMEILGGTVVDEEGNFIGILDSIEINGIGVVLTVDINPVIENVTKKSDPVKLVPREKT